MFVWNDPSANFVGATRELMELVEFINQQKVNQQKVQGIVSELFSSARSHVGLRSQTCPSFWCLWEAAITSMKTHLKRVVADVKLNLEEF